MTEREVYSLVQPCKNRGLYFSTFYKLGEIIIRDKVFSDLKEAEDYLEKIPRKDI
jgi:hypothetical protein